ncbi:halocyanin domain-containing protein [Halorarius halobius]|uniref:halocyanin domain-containing protein n=1 Tax=Halorarius halobius TaxID=2962671 RepID=UPI0020CC01EA|nr:halocyanin domain-containing protein [Halorarius halobius]
MDEDSPLDAPTGNWWNREVNRRETLWLGISGAWAMTLFGWMLGWTQAGEQNQIGPTYEISPDRYRQKVQSYKQEAGRLTVGGEELLVPSGEDVYVGALQWAWDGLPVVLRPGETYKFHLGAYDVQHGFSVRQENNLSQQLSLQVLPGYEWVVEMSFDDPGTYHVVCNEFCGTGHRSMHGRFLVRDYDDGEVQAADAGGDEDAPYGGWFGGETGGETANFDGSTADHTGESSVTVTVGAEGNGGTFAFDQPAVAVSPGTTVTFEWASDSHNVVVESQPDGAGWQGHEPIENSGFSFEHTFETEGVYTYYCQPHLSVGMKGVVEVR